MTDRPVTTAIPPVVREVTVSLHRAAAFERFTAGIATWWPMKQYSVGQEQTVDVVLESGLGGRIYERLHDGTEHEWGRVKRWDPPNQVAFSWYPDRQPNDGMLVTVRFETVAYGTRVEVTHEGWESLGADARTTRENYQGGWGGVLEQFAAATSGAVPPGTR